MAARAELVRTVAGIIGNVFSFALFASPMPTNYMIIIRDSVEESNAENYVAVMMMNCLMWILYGIPLIQPGYFLVLTANGIGLAIQLVYLIKFLICSKDEQRRKFIVLVCFAELVFTGIVSGLVIGLSASKVGPFFIGLIGLSCCMVASVPRLGIVIKGYGTKTNESISPIISVISIINGLCWLTYGFIRFDIFVLGCGYIGFSLGVVECMVYVFVYVYVCCGGTSKVSDEATRV